MGSPRIQMTFCFALGVIGLIGVIVCLTAPCWKLSTFVGNNIVTAQAFMEGLWMRCVVQSTGQHQCKTYDFLLALPLDLRAARVMTTISCLLSSFSLLIYLCGVYFNVIVENKHVKSTIILVATAGLELSGLLVIISVSWSANTMIRDWYNPILVQAQRRELGECIYVGWAAGGLLLVAGGLLCCCNWPESEEDLEYYTHIVYHNVPTPVKKLHVE